MESITFSKPQYLKIRNSATGAQEPLYRFQIHNGESLSDTTDRSEYPSLRAQLTSILHENNEVLQSLVREFLRINNTYFAKQYTIDMFLRNLIHTIHEPATPTIQSTEDGNTIVSIFNPIDFTIHNGKIQLNWKLHYESVRISIPVSDDDSEQNQPQPQSQSHPLSQTVPALATGHILAAAENQIIDATEIESLDDINIAESIAPEYTIANSSRQYEKGRVKEARLRARLAQYKAERAINRYLEKYGTEATDSEWSDDSSGGSESDSD
jgi:hypothetical protein